MKEGPNRELDGLKKLVSQRWRTQAVEPHPDPDVLSAFAENALPESERAQVLQHLGACNDCRDVLYLTAEHSPEAQQVLSFQPKRTSWLIFRWGALTASVVIVGIAVIARYPRLHEARMQAPAAPASESYSKLAEKRFPSDALEMRDRVASPSRTATPPPPPPPKDRPATKHMTAKPQANMEFDDSDQVRLAAPKAENKKKAEENLPVMGRNVGGPLPTLPNAGQSNQAAQYSTQQTADARSDFSYSARAVQKQAFHAAATGMIGGTVVDPSGAVIGNAKVTTVGPAGSKTATSDEQGNFAFDSLAPGAYSVKAEAPGFKSSEITNVAVLDNKSANVPVKLEVGNSAETVEVSGKAVTANVEAPSPAPETANGLTVAQPGIAMKKAVGADSPQHASSVTPRWTISAKGALERSLDLGKTWHKVSVAHGVIFRALSILGPQIWVGGSRGSLYRSSDFGQTWTKIVPSAEGATLTVDISHIEFPDRNTGTVSTTNGETWSTSDGGHTWRRQ